MRILILSQRYRAGGAERCARELFEGLRERGHDVEMWTAAVEANTPPGVRCIRTSLERALFPVHFLDVVSDWRHIGSRRELDRIGPKDFDVVHLHNLHGYWLSIRAVQRLCRRMPVVWTLHDEWAATAGVPYDLLSPISAGVVDENLWPTWKRRLVPMSSSSATATAWRRYLSEVMPRPSMLISPSKYLAEMVSKQSALQGIEVKVLPYGLKLLEQGLNRLDRAEARRRWNLPQTGPVVLLIAADMKSPYKGAQLGIEAIRRVALNLNHRLNVLLLGRNCNAIMEAISDEVNIVSGYARDDQQLCQAYLAADVTLLPSIADNLPYTALESFACGTPIVCFDIGGMTELAGNRKRGIAVRPFDFNHLCEGILELLNDPNVLTRIGAESQFWALKFCDFNDYIDESLLIYRYIYNLWER